MAEKPRRKYEATWRRFNRRVIVSAILSAITLPILATVGRKLHGNIFGLLLALGTAILLLAIQVAWILTFRCPRCGEFFFSPRELSRGTYACAHCRLPFFENEKTGER
jgi:hypothetical protein